MTDDEHRREYRYRMISIEVEVSRLYENCKRLFFIGYPPFEPINHFSVEIDHAPRGLIRRWIRKTLMTLNRMFGEPECGVRFDFFREEKSSDLIQFTEDTKVPRNF